MDNVINRRYKVDRATAFLNFVSRYEDSDIIEDFESLEIIRRELARLNLKKGCAKWIENRNHDFWVHNIKVKLFYNR